MKVLIIGHPIKSLKIKEIIEMYDDVDVNVYNMYDFDEIINNKEEITRKIYKNDITIISGKITFSWMSKYIILPDLVTYVPKNAECLMRAFLEVEKRGYNILNISIDSYSTEFINSIYNEIGLNKNIVKSINNNLDVFDSDFINKQAEFHKQAYTKNQVSCCVTGISDVYEILESNNIPVIMVNATQQTIKDTYEKIKLEKMLSEKYENELVFIYIEIKINDESINFENDYQFAHERMRVAEQIYLFSHTVNAAIEAISMRRYLLVTKSKYLIKETDYFQNIKLLGKVQKYSMSNISMGIGFGDTVREARNNAYIGVKKSSRKDKTCAYTVYSKENIEGPIYSQIDNDKEEIVDELFLKIANSSGLSLNTIFKLHRIICRYEKNIFTISELANYYETSLRTMYRIIEKLEVAGYANEAGKKIINNTGRPSRLFNIKIK